MVKEINRNGKTIHYKYNQDHNVISVDVDGSDDTKKYYYSMDGTLLAAANGEGIDVFEYAPGDYLKKKTRNGKTLVEYAYNQNGNITEVTSHGKTTKHSYDILGRLETVKEDNQLIADYAYNVDNTLSTLRYGNGIKIDYNYDRDKNITSIIQKNPQGNIINNFSYIYDARGNQSSKTENGESTIYTYDKVNRLKTVKYPVGTVEAFTYDNAGNRITKQKGSEITTYDYDTRNRLTRSTENGTITTYNYDNNGNLLKETTAGKITNYTYNSFNKITGVELPDGRYQLNHYDAIELRVGVTENGINHQFIHRGRDVISEVNSNTGDVTRYIRGNALIQAEDYRGITSYYLHNNHGDVMNLVNKNGEILNAYQYDAFGNTTSYGAKVANRFMYSGEQFDFLTGQYYLRARYYDPEVGRFIQEDPYRGDGLNLYTYVHNNPIKYIDPSGLMIEDGNGRSYVPRTSSFGSSSNSSVNRTSTSSTTGKCAPEKTSMVDKLKQGGKDFVAGVGVAIDTNVFLKGAQTITGNTEFPDTTAYKVGKVVGDAGTLVAGVLTTGKGIVQVAGGITGGIAAAPATGGVSVVAGGAVTVDGVASTAAGLTVTGVSAKNFIDDTMALFDGNGSKRGSNGNQNDWGNKNTLQDHYDRHGSDVGAKDPQDYAKKANEFYKNRSGHQVKVDEHGVTRVYDPKTNTFGSYNPDGTTRTYYKPTGGQRYFDSQPGK